MTNAILFNKMRGSGREVTINLIDSGIEIVSSAGEHIAVWPYQVVDLIKESEIAREGAFVADHDQIHLLQIFDAALWDRVMERTPRARKTEQGPSNIAWWRIWRGVPDNLTGIILLGAVVFLIGAAREAYLWLFPS